MNRKYNQTDNRWANKTLGSSGLNMKSFGCVVTDCAMILSEFLDREVFPSELLEWLNKNKGFTQYGALYWNKITEFSGGKLKYASGNDGDSEYALRQVLLGRYNHWVIKTPTTPNTIVDPLCACERQESYYKYTGQIRRFYGKPVQSAVLPVDERYGMKRDLPKEKYFAWPISGAGIHIRNTIKRVPTSQEVHGFAYGNWGIKEIYRGKVGDQWKYYTKRQYLKKINMTWEEFDKLP